MEVVQPIRDPVKIRQIATYLKSRSERDYLMFTLGIYTGLRISDLLMLQIRDVRQKQHISIVEAKTNKRKKVKITTKLQKIIEAYVDGKEDEEFLFASRQGYMMPISRSRAYEILKDAARQCNVKNIGTHSMRKTFGYMLYSQTKDIALLQDLLNHSSPAVTLRYIGLSQENQDIAIDSLKIYELD